MWLYICIVFNKDTIKCTAKWRWILYIVRYKYIKSGGEAPCLTFSFWDNMIDYPQDFVVFFWLVLKIISTVCILSSTYHRRWAGKSSNNSLWNKETQGKQRRKNKRKVLWSLLDGFTLGKYLQSPLSLSLKDSVGMRRPFLTQPSLPLLPLHEQLLGHRVPNQPGESERFSQSGWCFSRPGSPKKVAWWCFFGQNCLILWVYVERRQVRLNLQEGIPAFFPLYGQRKIISVLRKQWEGSFLTERGSPVLDNNHLLLSMAFI